MRKNNRSVRLLLPALTAIVLLSRCGTDTAGGSEIGNPKTTITGIVVDSTGSPVSKVTMYLTVPYIAIPESTISATTGSDGRYSISGLPSGHYNLAAVGPGDSDMFHKTVTVSAGSKNDDTLLDLGPDTLRNSATIIVMISDTINTPAFVFIPGSIFRTRIDSDGEYLLLCPEMTTSVQLLSGNSVRQLIPIYHFNAGEWYDFTGRTFIIPVPSISSGVVSGTAGREYTFLADEVTIDPPHPVDYRFDWGDTVSSWSRSPGRTHAWNTAGTYAVRVQARSVRDTLSLSAWSEAETATIR